ncbi:MAG: alanine--tRNA ligase, partial [Pikeienuella sp.]
MASLNDIRSTFFDAFVKNGHTQVESSPLVPRNDPTLMFTNAGMVQFKNVFTGLEQRDYSRAVTSQKCVRAGGKHNDLDNVGYTARHHTFFEMLGNFSFGDYFKEDAIPFAWDLLTKEYGLPKEKLLVTIYHDDDEAANIWKKHAGLSDDRIIRIATDDNFWSMGATGPCGPCSEIFFDHGDHIWGGPPGSPDEDGDRFIEIWNLVFMQYEKHEDGSRTNLPKPSIDTGMGLERIGAVLQGKHDNYDTDLMRDLIEASAQVSGVDPDGDKNVHHRVIADHLRSTSFLIADGVLPSNEGRGYVLRRIMRRAMRHAHLLGVQDPMMHKLVPALVTQMGQAFPELSRAQPMIEETLELEEKRFQKTLDRGLALLDDALDGLPEGETLPGETAFKLYDTYGFPLDLTQDALREKGRAVDTDGFDAAMAEQKAKARAAWSGSGEAADAAIWFDIADQHGVTEFLGYDTEVAEGQCLALVVDGAVVSEIAQGGSGWAVFNQTPFYAESGGQVGDAGVIRVDGVVANVTDTKKLQGVFAHQVEVAEGTLKVGAGAELLVDHARRSSIRANHSATHLLHEALRGHLGDHVAQRGSLNDVSRLRFDFSHSKGMSSDEIKAVEAEVNDYIRQNSPVTTRLMTPDEARE